MPVKKKKKKGVMGKHNDYRPLYSCQDQFSEELNRDCRGGKKENINKKTPTPPRKWPI